MPYLSDDRILPHAVMSIMPSLLPPAPQGWAGAAIHRFRVRTGTNLRPVRPRPPPTPRSAPRRARRLASDWQAELVLDAGPGPGRERRERHAEQPDTLADGEERPQ